MGNFKKRVRVENIKESNDKMTMEFDLIGVDASFANTLRRMMISGIYVLLLLFFFIKYNLFWKMATSASGDASFHKLTILRFPLPVRNNDNF